MGAVPVEFAPGFNPRSFMGGAVQPVADMAASGHLPNRDPHILLATVGRLPSTARLAMELHAAGARVSLIAPRNHPAKVLDLISSRMTYRTGAPLRSLEAALLRVCPDMVIPCDERTVRDLQAICRRTRHEDIRLLIQRSTSPAESFPTIASRAELLLLARRQGARVPVSTPLADARALERWIAKNPAPFVLRSDGSRVERGMRIISDARTAEDAFVKMARRTGGLLAGRGALLPGNSLDIRSWLSRERPAMSVENYMDGRTANIGVACWQGEVLAAVCTESVATRAAMGSSTVARVIHNPGMIDTAGRIVKALSLSGLVCFDFMIEAATGAACLIQMSAHSTPVCALRLGPGRDLTEALVARLAARPAKGRPPRTERDIVAFFPDAWREDPSNQFLRGGYHDVPWEQPALLRMLMQPERPERYWVSRMLHRVWLAIRQERGQTTRRDPAVY
ncbi:MAG: hypothetical protein P4L90_02305 [Rhodopila sp.]|nr:hypothetical protein [Rhodopila sp.]